MDERSNPSLNSEPLAGRDLAAFVAAVETGTVQGAAERLTLTQSAATKRIQALEKRLDTSLLDRSRNGVSPTEAGRLLYPEARRAIEALVMAERAVTDNPDVIVTRVAASHTVGEYLFPGWLSRLRREAFEVHPQVDVVNSPTVLKQLRASEIEIGFVEGIDQLSGLEAKVVAADEIVAVVACNHPWADRPSLCAKDLRSDLYISREQGSGTRAVAEARLHEMSVNLEADLQLSSLEGVKRALAGGGFTLISSLAIESEILNKSLIALPITDVNFKRHLFAVRRGNASPALGAELLWGFMMKISAEQSEDL